MRKEINGLNLFNNELLRENFKFELELDEAVAIINEKETELENNRLRLKITEDQHYEATKELFIEPSEMFTLPPEEIHKKFKKQSVLLSKQTNQIKKLLEEKQTQKITTSELKSENEHLRLKVVNLTENDIERKILDYAIEQNKKLENKIIIQRDRTINLGMEIKNEMQTCDLIKNENLTLKAQIQSLESSAKKVGERPDDEWETTSESSVKISSPSSNEPLEKLLKKALKSLGEKKTEPKKKISEINPKNNSNKENESKNSPKNNPSSRVNANPHNKTICKFYMQNRCKFNERCFNIHPPKNNYVKNYIPPWNYNVANPNLGSSQQESIDSRPWTYQHNPGFRRSPGRGKPAGYWSLPPSHIPLNNSFSPLSEMNLDYEFPVASY